MKVSLIVPLVSFSFCAACSPVLLTETKQEKNGTRFHSSVEDGVEKQKGGKSSKKSPVVLPQVISSVEGSGKKLRDPVKKQAKGLQQALVVYSTELVPITMSGDGKEEGGESAPPVMRSKSSLDVTVKSNPYNVELVRRKRTGSSLEQVRKKTASFVPQRRWNSGSKDSKVSVFEVSKKIKHTDKLRVEESHPPHPPLYIPVQSEQELKEELTALEKTGDWSDSGEGKQAVLSSYGIQCDLPQSFAPVQLDLDVDFISSIAQGNPSVQLDQESPSKELICDFPIVINKQVEFYLDQFQNRQRTTFELWLKRSANYLTLIKNELKKAELPEALVYLSMIESGFNPIAYSPASASGLWQFMPSTARSYGLRVDSWVDERRNPEKATTAAVSYLSALYKRFGDWQLAVAAYNAGEGKIQRGLEKYKAKNFWDLAAGDYLPLETKRYVPKLIAAIIIAHEPERYGFQTVQAKKVSYDVIEVPSQTSLGAIAAAGGYSVDKIRQLNSELLKNKIPRIKGKGTYLLKVPAGTSTRVAAKLQQILTREKRKVIHRLRKGETLSRVGQRYDVSVNMIMQWNDIANARRIRAGKRLVLYPYRKADQGTSKVGKAEKGGAVSYYKVRNGDSLWSIARKHQVSTQEIKRWNRLDNNLLHPGKKLVIKKS